jgi:hypothetical protein
MLLCAAVEGPPLAAPPASPPLGSCYVVANGATGAWAGQDGALAAYTDGGWRFVASIDGMRLIDRMSGQSIVRRGTAWETGIVRSQEVRINDQIVVRERQGAIANPTGGAVTDGECRSAVANILAALRGHGLIA